MARSRLKLGLIVGRNETWSFIDDLYQDWQTHYQVDVFGEHQTGSPFFKERLNRRRLRSDLAGFMADHDVVFFEWASELLAIATTLPKTCRIVTRLHRYEMYDWADEIQWEAVDQIILVSEAKRNEFVNRFPDQASKCMVINEAINLEKFRFRPKPFSGQLGILCHLSPRKRVYELILAFCDLVGRYPQLHLHIGGGHEKRYADYYFGMTDLVQRLGLDSSVTFHGPVDDTAAWYHQIDIYVSNSYSEGLQVSPMEAMASGCFCLSHHWAGADELLPAECLYFTEAELQRLIIDYIELAPARQSEQVQRMRSIVERKFDVEKAASKFRAVIEGVGST